MLPFQGKFDFTELRRTRNHRDCDNNIVCYSVIINADMHYEIESRVEAAIKIERSTVVILVEVAWRFLEISRRNTTTIVHGQLWITGLPCLIKMIVEHESNFSVASKVQPWRRSLMSRATFHATLLRLRNSNRAIFTLIGAIVRFTSIMYSQAIKTRRLNTQMKTRNIKIAFPYLLTGIQF